MIIDEGDYLAHYGTLRKSGRYPWGSGGDDSVHTLVGTADKLRKEGMTEREIAAALGMSTTQLRQARTIAKDAKRNADLEKAQKLKDKGWSNVAIGKEMGIPESSVRAMLQPGQREKLDILKNTTNMLRDEVSKNQHVDIGKGVEAHLGISREKLKSAVKVLKDEGYAVHYVPVEQLGTGKTTTVTTLSAPGTNFKEVATNIAKVKPPFRYSEDGGRSYDDFMPPIQVSSKRISVRYAEQGGSKADGVIYIRPGVKDLSLGGARYAQVRIAVEGTHYLKGMAILKDDLPHGVDLEFNTNKSDTGNKLDAMKAIKDDPDLPFGSVVRQLKETNPDGTKRVTSALNIVNSEGKWGEWSKTLSAQVLSKQPPALAKKQLDIAYDRKRKELDEILNLDNVEVKKKLLQSYSDGVDSAAVHLKAAAIHRQQTQVILPVNSMKPTEVYAPNFRDGERVVLIRYPHGGKFEIPELVVNNRHPEARKLLGDAKDAIGIHSDVAAKLSGADFDGDTVLVIPNNDRKIKSEPALDGLKGFDPMSYKASEDMPRMTARQKGTQMGLVSNLISDMTIKGATNEELARAVRHSMVVIDAEKHHLDYKRSAIDNGISALTKQYQAKPNGRYGGASTVVSNSGTSSTVRVFERTPRPAKDGGPIDRATGKKVFVETGATYTVTKVNKRTGEVTTKEVRKMDKTPSTKLGEVDDAHVFSSGTQIEGVYADHSNRMKALANEARKVMVNTPSTVRSPSAAKVYAREVASLEAKLAEAVRNSPLERRAQILANASLQKKRDANPDMGKDELKKLKSRELLVARARTGAKNQKIEITPAEWAAIQAGAITPTKLRDILENTDLDKVKELATPKEHKKLSPSYESRARLMKASGHTNAEIADALGVSIATLQRSLGGEQNG